MFAQLNNILGKAFRCAVVMTLLVGAGMTAATAHGATKVVALNVYGLTAHYDEEQFLFLDWAIPAGHHIVLGTIVVMLNGQQLEILAAPDQEGTAGTLLTAIVLDETPAEGEVFVTYRGCSDDDIGCRTLTDVIDLRTLDVTNLRPETN